MIGDVIFRMTETVYSSGYVVCDIQNSCREARPAAICVREYVDDKGRSVRETLLKEVAPWN